MNLSRILLADDHQLLLGQVAILLQPSFHVVGSTHNGLEMISEVMRLQPDVIVADISMPILSGIDAAHQLKEAGCLFKVVFLTIHAEKAFVDACLAEGALDYVVKSHIRTDLILAIKGALSGSLLFLQQSLANIHR